jgi:thymidylate kinase
MVQAFRWLCTARDRYRLYKKACRFAANGGIVVSDRFPIDRLRLMDGPRIVCSPATSLTAKVLNELSRRENWYYGQILRPDVMVVLRVDPETAVTRKTSEPAEHVRSRATELWHVDWNGSNARLVDTGKSLNEVVADLRSYVWQAL